MFTQIETRDVRTEGVLQSNAFTIKANGKAFKVLIDGLYSDKVRSIIRELWSNAFDSHIEARKADVAFDCQLPTVWEPVFRVRDYGVSLSHDNVMHLYTTVFESTKESTNAQVGKLGLGSKSPFAYTDTFTVTTWLDGVKNVYSAYIGTDSVPMIAMLGTEPSDEPQGLEVTFPVKSGDIEKFEKAASRAALGFDVKPNTFDVVLDSEVSDEVLYEGQGWKLYAYGDIRAQAKQGCVIYPIDAYAVDGVTDTQREFLKSPLLIEFPIGDLEIAASREGLGYDAPTCANIVREIARIETEILAQFQARFDGIKTYWEACEMYDRVLTSESLPSPVVRLMEKMTFKGRKLKSSIHVNMASVRKIDTDVARGRRVRNRGGWEGHTNVYVKPRTAILYFQDAAQKITRIKDRLKLHYASVPYGKDIIVVRAPLGSYEAKRILVALGRPTEFVDVATLPLPPKDPNKTTRTSVPLRYFSTSYHERWKETKVDPAVGGIYVPLERGEAKNSFSGSTMHDSDVQTVITALTELGYMSKTDVVYGIPATHKRLPERNDKWITLWDFAKKVMDEGFDGAVIGRYRSFDRVLEDFHSDVGTLIRAWHQACVVPDATGPAYKLLREYGVIASEHAALKWCEPFRSLMSVFPDYKETPVPLDIDLSSLTEEMEAKYPLLKTFLKAAYVNEDNGKLLLDYVNLVDSHDSLPNIVSILSEEAA